MTVREFTLLVSLLGLTVAATRAREQTVSQEELPQAVRSVLEARSQGATVLGLWTESEHGKIIYEIELDVRGHRQDISVDENGNIVEVEEEIPLSALPVGARSAIMKAAGKNGNIPLVQSVWIGSASTGSNGGYRAVLVKGHKKSEIRVNAAGKLLPAKD